MRSLPFLIENPRRVANHGAGNLLEMFLNGEPGTPSSTCPKYSAPPSACEGTSPRADGGPQCANPM